MATIKQSNSLADFEKIARQLARSFKGGETIGLIGDLGAGKTTMVQFLADELGVKEKVNSPTFVLMKVYNTSNNKIKILVHVDAYRLNHSDEFKNIGLEEYFNRSDCVVVIEWADRVKDFLPADATIITIKEGEGEIRTMEIS